MGYNFGSKKIETLHGEAYALHGNLQPLEDKINELIDTINHINEVLDSNMIHKKHYEGSPYDLSSIKKRIR